MVARERWDEDGTFLNMPDGFAQRGVGVYGRGELGRVSHSRITKLHVVVLTVPAPRSPSYMHMNI